MTPRKLYSFAIDPDIADALKRVKVRDGVGESEQIRRALRRWFETAGEIEKADRRRAPTRKRS